jgi:hypothetical protein
MVYCRRHGGIAGKGVVAAERLRPAGTISISPPCRERAARNGQPPAGPQITGCWMDWRQRGRRDPSDAGTFFEWDHYPKGDVYDAETMGATTMPIR